VILEDRAKAERYIDYASAIALILGLLITAYGLNTSEWYPAFLSAKGVAFNTMVTLVFCVFGYLILRQPRAILLPPTLAIGFLMLLIFGYSSYSQSRALVRFSDVAQDVGLREMDNSLGIAWGDYDDDGWLDLFVSNHLPAATYSLLYRNDHGVFNAPKLMAKGDLHGAAWGDFDNDGALDLFVAGGNDTPKGPAYPNFLFHNADGRLQDVASSAGVQDTLGRAWGAAWADFDKDGYLDLFVANYFTSSVLFRNSRDGTFREMARAAGMTRTAPGDANEAGTLCASWADYDRDGDVDLLTVAIGTGIALYRNGGDGSFSDVARYSGLVSDSYLGTEQDPRGLSGCAWGDYDNDGDLDLYIAALTGAPGRNLLYQNQGTGTFVEVGAIAGVDTAAYSRAAMWGDFDNDGDLDLYVVNEASDRTGAPDGEYVVGWNDLYLNRSNGTFGRVAADSTGAAGFPFVQEGTAALADYDNDGFIDIFVNNQKPLRGRAKYMTRNMLLRNSGNSNNWLQIQLVGSASNREGIGAKITLTAGGQRQFREKGTESHTFAQNSTTVHFGLGQATVADQVLIEWPSGAMQTLTNVVRNQILTVTEPVSGS
jgi:hypothetical protein